MPRAAGGDKLKAKPHFKMNGVVVGTVIGSIHPPAGDGHREISGKSDIDVGATK